MSKKNKVGIVGAGWVGTACEINFSALPNTDVRVYDKFKDTESLETVVKNSNVIFVCVPTPRVMTGDYGACDTSIVEEVVMQIATLARKPKTIVLKSTVPPGTTKRLANQYPGHAFFFNPEFLTEKGFIDDFANQDRIILGTTGSGSPDLCNLYDAFVKNQKVPAVLLMMESKEAEMLKYATNCFLATKVSFMNELKEICDASNIDFQSVSRIMKYDKRIGLTHMNVPGPDGQLGFGGSCFPKDLTALIAYAQEREVDPILMESAWAKNLLVREDYDWNHLPQVSGNYVAEKTKSKSA